jgi:hypothetical protein
VAHVRERLVENRVQQRRFPRAPAPHQDQARRALLHQQLTQLDDATTQLLPHGRRQVPEEELEVLKPAQELVLHLHVVREACTQSKSASRSTRAGHRAKN